MFVSVTYDLSGEDSQNKIREILIFYGFKEVLSGVFETNKIMENTLKRLKRDIDRISDHYDRVRFYQYPYDGQMVITMLEKKNWKRIILE
jgi:CRISPR-associated endonuclease Cas2